MIYDTTILLVRPQQLVYNTSITGTKFSDYQPWSLSPVALQMKLQVQSYKATVFHDKATTHSTVYCTELWVMVRRAGCIGDCADGLNSNCSKNRLAMGRGGRVGGVVPVVARSCTAVALTSRTATPPKSTNALTTEGYMIPPALAHVCCCSNNRLYPYIQ